MKYALHIKHFIIKDIKANQHYVGSTNMIVILMTCATPTLLNTPPTPLISISPVIRLTLNLRETFHYNVSS